ncbi:PilZ domain-containing protein [Treponema sp. OMZ 840]|uniref:PilZ domain-containing protein n=1 Tax=Treponema sp. OMZ 840 TaxID=244313 RepID=UPI003D94BB6C
MYTLGIVVVSIVLLIFFMRIIVLLSPRIKFFTSGFDAGFTFGEIRSVWSVVNAVKPEDPCAFFDSVPLMDRTIGIILRKAEKNNTSKSEKVQSLLNRLYACRTKLELDPNSKRGIKDTRYITKGQKLRLLVRGVGVFYAHVMQNGRQLIISLPLENGELTVSGEKWVGKKVVVYFHRQDDAFYIFDTVVTKALLFNGRNALSLAHSYSLLRSQKRKSVRCDCFIHALLFLGARKKEERLIPERSGGLKCILEDISEDGALIRIRGKGKAGIIIKLQFQLEGKRVIMYGVSKFVEYDKDNEESHIHFQCLQTTPWFRNTILGYVYKILPHDYSLI